VVAVAIAEKEAQKTTRVRIKIRKPNSDIQAAFVWDMHLRQIIKAGRQLGKTVGAAIKAASAFIGVCFRCKGMKGDLDCPDCHGTGRVAQKRVLYAAPTDEQVGKFWFEVTSALAHPIALGIFKVNQAKKEITVPGTDIKLKAKTAYNPDTLRGGTWQLLILEEFQLMKEQTWGEVGIPMLARYRGTAVFIFTPPRLGSDQKSYAKDPRHASKMYNQHKDDEPDENGLQRWMTFHGTSHDNPDLDPDALDEMLEDMTMDAYRREILAEDDEIEGMWMVNQKWNESICRIKRFPIPKSWPVKTSQDYGPANTAALFAAQVREPKPPGAPDYMRAGDVIIFAEYKPQGSRTNKQHVQHWQDITEGYHVIKNVGGAHGEDQIRQGFSDIGWPTYEPLMSGPNSVKAQIERVINLQEHNSLYLFIDNTGLYLEFCNMMWELDDDNMPTDKIANESKYHYFAALRYLAPEYDVSITPNKMPEPQSY
jgi:hypothetical protein